MPIGNLTSQIFANIYLNELDRFVKHELKVKYYLRYGDDFILIHQDLEKVKKFRTKVIRFLNDRLRLNLNRRNMKRIKNRITLRNAGSYYGLVKKHSLSEFRHEFDWWIYELLESEF